MAEINDVYEARVVCTQGLQTAITVRHYKAVTKTGTGSTDAEFATQLSLAFQANWKALMATDATFRGVGVHKITPLPATTEVSSIANLGAGTVAGDPLPAQISGLITLRSNLAGRSNRGRSYIPFPAESDNEAGGHPTLGYNGRLAALALTLKTSLVSGSGGNENTWSPVIFSKKLGTAIFIITAEEQDRWATQRSRGGYGRPNPPPF